MAQRLQVWVLLPAGIVGERSEWPALSSNFNTMAKMGDTKRPTAPRGLLHYCCPLLQVCVFTTVCVHLDGLNTELKFWVWDTCHVTVTFIQYTPSAYALNMYLHVYM